MYKLNICLFQTQKLVPISIRLALDKLHCIILFCLLYNSGLLDLDCRKLICLHNQDQKKKGQLQKGRRDSKTPPKDPKVPPKDAKTPLKDAKTPPKDVKTPPKDVSKAMDITSVKADEQEEEVCLIT